MVNATPRSLYPMERDSVPIVQEAWVGPGPVWTGEEKSRPPPGFDPRNVQTVASRYTDWAIPAHKRFKKKTRDVVGHPVGTKFLSLYIMY
jgi:hypothetical protein